MARIELEGLEELINTVQRMGSEGGKIENKALKEAGAVMKESIQNEAPVRTGKLKESITVSGIKTKDGVKCVEVGPSKEDHLYEQDLKIYHKVMRFQLNKEVL